MHGEDVEVVLRQQPIKINEEPEDFAQNGACHAKNRRVFHGNLQLTISYERHATRSVQGCLRILQQA